MFLVGLLQVEVGMCRALRMAFRHHHQFRWDPDPRLSRIAILDQWPLAEASYPRVIVNAGAGDLLSGHRGIGDEFADMETTPITIQGASYAQATTVISSGTNRIGATLTVEARSKSEALQVADWCALFVRSFSVDKFRREGLYVEDMTSTPPSARMEGSDPVYSVTLNLKCLTEFCREIPVSVTETVDGVCLVGVFTTINGATYGETFG